jgi:hypothetical protein
MRHLKTQAEIIRRGLKEGHDPKDMPTEANFPKDQNKIDPSMGFHVIFILCFPS